MVKLGEVARRTNPREKRAREPKGTGNILGFQSKAEDPTPAGPPDLDKIFKIDLIKERLLQIDDLLSKILAHSQGLAQKLPEFLGLHRELHARQDGLSDSTAKKALQPDIDRMDAAIRTILSQPEPYRGPACVQFAMALSTAGSEEELQWGIEHLLRAKFFVTPASRQNREALFSGKLSVILGFEFSQVREAQKAFADLKELKKVFYRREIERYHERVEALGKEAEPNGVLPQNITARRTIPAKGILDIFDKGSLKGGVILYEIREGQLTPLKVVGRHPAFEELLEGMIEAGVYLDLAEVEGRLGGRTDSRLLDLTKGFQRIILWGRNCASKATTNKR